MMSTLVRGDITNSDIRGDITSSDIRGDITNSDHRKQQLYQTCKS